MKKLISMLLAVAMLASLGCAAFADDEGVTKDKVLGWLYEGDEAAETVDDQLANDALRLAEMMVALNNAVGLTRSDADRLEDDLAALEQVDSPDVDNDIKLATGLVRALDAFIVFEKNVDPNGKYDVYMKKILDEYDQNYEAADTARQQAVNALYAMVRVAALMTEMNCLNQEMVDQVEAGLTEFGNDEAATETVSDQLANGSRWLCKMLGALVKILDMTTVDGGFYAQADEMVEDAQQSADAEPGPKQQAADWLYQCVHMAGVLTDLVAAA